MGHIPEELADRYQCQPWYVKIWRRRHYILITYYTVRYWLCDRKKDNPIGWINCWGIEVGSAQILMKWYYTTEEVFGEEWPCQNDEKSSHL